MPWKNGVQIFKFATIFKVATIFGTIQICCAQKKLF